MSDEEEYSIVETDIDVVVGLGAVETSDRGLFDVFGKKDEQKKVEEAAISSEFEEKVHVSQPEPEEKKEKLLEKLHRSDSSSSSSSDEESDQNGEKKKKKKEKKPVLQHGPPEPEEKKSFIEKIKEKLPGGHKKTEEEHAAHSPQPAVVAADEGEQKEKKGIFEKIKEKIPGYHSKSEEEKEKEKVKECD